MTPHPHQNSESTHCSCLEGIPHALTASAHGHGIRRGKHRLSGAAFALSHLGDGVDDTADKAQSDGADAGKRDGCIEEDETAHGDGEFVKSADHAVRGGRGDAHAPGRRVRDEDGGEAGEDHCGDDLVALRGGEVEGDVLRAPVLEEERAEQEDWDRQQIVVVHGVKVLEVGQLDPLAHAEHVSGAAEAVEQHPEVAGV